MITDIEIIPSSLQNKKWRKECSWYIDGKRNECEIYQRNIIEKITNQVCKKTNVRINFITNEMIEKMYPMKELNGFEWSEDFDGKIIENEKQYFFNMKMVCDAGGAQTRSLREVYHFINSQLKFLEKNQNIINIYFINILDGDYSNKHIDKFLYLVNKPEFINICKYVFIGDMVKFTTWWSNQHPPFISPSQVEQPLPEPIEHQ
jgi:hypothetical protein